jgi:nucleotide-binding universal stress UspA family protein
MNARITLLHAIQVASPVYAGSEIAIPEYYDVPAMQADAKRELESFFEPPPGIPVDTVAELGDAANVITCFAQSHAIDLIMMPTHGRGKFRSLLIGSVTAKVLHDAACPVWTMAHSDHPASTGHIACRNILCAIDLSERSEEMVRRSEAWARMNGATLRLVHAIPVGDATTSPYFEESIKKVLVERGEEAVRDLQRKAGTELDVILRVGRISDVVRQAAIEGEVDLVVIGRGRVQKPFGRLRTNAYAIIRDAPCPVVSV